MNILYLDESLPYPIDTGKRTRTYHLLSHLAKRHRVTLLVYVWSHAQESAAIRHLEEIGIRVIAVPRREPKRQGIGFYAKLAGNLLSAFPFIVSDHFSAAYKECVGRALAEITPQILVAEWTPYAVYFDGIQIPKVVVAHNIESRIWQGYIRHCSNFLKRWYIRQQCRKVESFERHTFRNINGLIVVSPVEQQLIQAEFPSLPISLIDNGVDIHYFNPDHGSEEPDLVTFVGSMDWRPNEDAVYYFAEHILPYLRQAVPSIRVEIVGRNPTDGLRRLASRLNLTVTGRVDDVRPYLNRAAVVVVPLRIGGGSRLKILEAFSMEKAVVSTSLGAEGLKGIRGQDILIADDPKEFADRTVELMGNGKLRATMGRSARALVTDHYDWRSLAEGQITFLEKIANGSTRAS
jgi:polysaccharide biosynthesis protein PslH